MTLSSIYDATLSLKCVTEGINYKKRVQIIFEWKMTKNV